MSVTGTVVFLAILTLLNYRLRRSILYPPFIFCGIWLLDMAVYWIYPIEIDQIHSITLNVICGGAIMFTVGGIGAFFVPKKLIGLRITIARSRLSSGRTLKSLMIIVLALGVCFQVRFLAELASSSGGGGGTLIAVARAALIEDADQASLLMRLFNYITTWAIFSTVLFQMEHRDRMFKVMAGLAFASCIASSGRGQLLFFLSAISCVYVIQTRQEGIRASLRFLRWPLLGFGALFVILMFTNKNTENLTLSPAVYVLQSIGGYLCGSVAAFDLVLKHPKSFIHSGALPGTLRSLFTAASGLGLMSYTPPPTFEDYVFVPFPINTFTIYKSFYVDYGLFSSVAIMAVISFFHTLLYRRARTGSQLGTYIFALTMYPVLLAFFVEAYTAFTLYVHALLFGIAYIALRSVPANFFRHNAQGLVSRTNEPAA